jgi:endonuclease I
MKKIREAQMKRKIIGIVLFFLFISIISAQATEGYYRETEGKSGFHLKTTLHQIVKNHQVITYNQLWEAYKTTDTKPDNIVWDMYSDIPGNTPPYTYTHGNKKCGNYSKEFDCYNREHLLPQSWFNKRSPMKSDLFHVFPTDGFVNHERGSYPFGEVDNPTWTSLNGSKKGPCSHEGYSGTAFEPIDEYKGDIARSYFYMATRYEHKIIDWKGNGTASLVLDGSKDKVFKNWVISLFMEWHQMDPVSQKEIDRNNAVYKIQKNRNPFIDNPEFAKKIWIGDTPIEAEEVTLVSETFDTNPSDWILYSVSGNKDWNFNNRKGYMEINAYKGSAPSNDWLISPALNLDIHTGEKLRFKTWTKYNDSNYPSLKVKISTNYQGSGDPGLADWREITITLSPEDSRIWASSVTTNISTFDGESVYIGFHYTSTGTGKGTSSAWRVDNISVSGKREQ